MSRKSPWIILSLFAFVGAIFAAGILFPDTPWLPRIPTGAGTIGWVLKSAFFKADGTVTNTDKLAYVSASGYLQNRDCTSEWFDTVWMGVDILGRAKCGHRIIPLAMIGKFTYIDGAVEVMKYGSTVWTPANLTDPLIPWDIVRTWANGSGTIGFIDDNSYLRLDINTYVELKTGINTIWQSVAEAILIDGSLWWRILSSTGLNLGWWGMVAGIRWTSIGIQKIGTDYQFSIVDSQNTYHTADMINAAVGGISPEWVVPYMTNDMDGDGDFDPVDMTIPWSPWNTPVPVVWRIITHPNNSLTIEDGNTIGKVNILWGSVWVRENIKKDIVALDYIANSGGLDAMEQMRVDNELIAAVPKNINECNNTLVGNIIEKGKDALPWTELLSTAPCAVWNTALSDTDKRNSIICAIEWRNYWIGLSGANKCQKSDVIAIADYTTGDNKMYYNGGINSSVPKYNDVILSDTPAISGGGIAIPSPKYIAYPLSIFPGGAMGLAGKKITITLVGSPIPNRTFVDFGVIGTNTTYRVKINLTGCQVQWTSASCTRNNNSDGSYTYEFIAPSIPSEIRHFVIWNNYDSFGSVVNPAFTTPIWWWAKIQKIVISN